MTASIPLHCTPCMKTIYSSKIAFSCLSKGFSFVFLSMHFLSCFFQCSICHFRSFFDPFPLRHFGFFHLVGNSLHLANHYNPTLPFHVEFHLSLEWTFYTLENCIGFKVLKNIQHMLRLYRYLVFKLLSLSFSSASKGLSLCLTIAT